MTYSRLRAFAPAFRFSFFCGVVLFVIGNVASFYPGAESIWFLCTAVLLLPGVLLARRGHVVAAILMFALSLLYSATGHSRGVEYQRWLDAQEHDVAGADR